MRRESIFLIKIVAVVIFIAGLFLASRKYDSSDCEGFLFPDNLQNNLEVGYPAYIVPLADGTVTVVFGVDEHN
jgi:hypothetical protein